MESPYCSVLEVPIENVKVPEYSEEEHGTWELLLKAQEKLAPLHACPEFLEGLQKIAFPKTRIPKVKDISKRLEELNSWKLCRVEGLVHPKDFFSLLSRKIFPTTDFIRKRSDLMYTPAPDMFHDLYGHTPLLTNPDFTEFFEFFGKVGVRAHEKFEASNPIHDEIQRIYWFTVEFGLIDTPAGVKAYGSGSTSSPEELAFCVGPKCRRHPFQVEEVSKKTFDIWKLQEDVFVIPSFQELGKSFRAWAKQKGLSS